MPNANSRKITAQSRGMFHALAFALAWGLVPSVDAATGAQAAATSPCPGPAEYRALDFWVGDWVVETAQGKPAGRSHVELVLDQCVVFENWTGRNGYTGKSFNLYRRETGKWEQVWVDNMGDIVKFEGEAREGNVVYRTEVKDRDGRPAVRRMTFFPRGPNEVRQLGERSLDGGSTWTTDYDLIYKREREK